MEEQRYDFLLLIRLSKAFKLKIQLKYYILSISCLLISVFMNPSQVDGWGIDGEVIPVQMPSEHEAKMLVSTSEKKTREHFGRSFDVSIITLANLSK